LTSKKWIFAYGNQMYSDETWNEFSFLPPLLLLFFESLIYTHTNGDEKKIKKNPNFNRCPWLLGVQDKVQKKLFSSSTKSFAFKVLAQKWKNYFKMLYCGCSKNISTFQLFLFISIFTSLCCWTFSYIHSRKCVMDGLMKLFKSLRAKVFFWEWIKWKWLFWEDLVYK
jgi:hypothetical protein